MRSIRTKSQGFTLLELLVVIVIIGLLIGFVAPDFFKQLGKSEVTSARAQMESLTKALDQYRLDTGRYPDSDPGLQALVEKPVDATKWNGPYLRSELPLDPWGSPYVYRHPSNSGRDFDLMSLGRDGQPGGTGEDQDILPKQI